MTKKTKEVKMKGRPVYHLCGRKASLPGRFFCHGDDVRFDPFIGCVAQRERESCLQRCGVEAS